MYVAHPAGALSLELRLAFREVGWRLQRTLVWKKDTFVLGHADDHYAHEPILFGYVPGGGRRGRGGALVRQQRAVERIRGPEAALETRGIRR